MSLVLCNSSVNAPITANGPSTLPGPAVATGSAVPNDNNNNDNISEDSNPVTIYRYCVCSAVHQAIKTAANQFCSKYC